MEKESQNNWHQLAEKLDGLESLPGESPLNSISAWETLYPRLHPARRYVATWWWAAAGLLLLFSGSVVVYFNNKQGSVFPSGNSGSGIVQTAPVPGETRITGRTGSRTAAKEVTATNNRSAVPGRVKSGFSPASRFETRRDRVKKTTISTAGSLVPPAETETSVAASQNHFESPAPETMAVAMDSFRLNTATVRKPLRVIYLNELEEPGIPEEGHDNAGRSTSPVIRHLFPLHWHDRLPATGSSLQTAPSVLLRFNLNGGD